jgi:hypothetical protein
METPTHLEPVFKDHLLAYFHTHDGVALNWQPKRCPCVHPATRYWQEGIQCVWKEARFIVQLATDCRKHVVALSLELPAEQPSFWWSNIAPAFHNYSRLGLWGRVIREYDTVGLEYHDIDRVSQLGRQAKEWGPLAIAAGAMDRISRRRRNFHTREHLHRARS